MDEWVDEYMDGYMDGWRGGWMGWGCLDGDRVSKSCAISISFSVN